MNYLDVSEYEAHGLDAATPTAWITAASAVIDAHCRRPSLAVTQYEERIRLLPDSSTARLSYLPLAPDGEGRCILGVRARYGQPRRGESPDHELAGAVARTFVLPGTWIELDPGSVEVCEASGEITLPMNVLGLSFGEVEVTYTAGLQTIPETVKVACAMVVRNAQATPALNVRAGSLDRLHLEYFSDSLLDETVRSLLAPYVAQKVG
jgi:hypothetical protein